MIDFLDKIDHEIFEWIQFHLRNTQTDYWFTVFRDKHSWIALYLFLLVRLFFLFGIKTFRILALVILLITITDQLNSSVLKKWAQRDRPCNEIYFKDNFTPAINCSGGYSFPSSHATNHMGIAVFLVLIFNSGIWRFLLIPWAVLIGFSQVYVGVHFPFDVMAGFMEGAIIAALLYYVSLKSKIWDVNKTFK